MEKISQKQENLTEQEKINIVRNYFHGIEDQMYLFFVELADIKLKTGEAQSFYQAVDILLKERLGATKNKSKPTSVNDVEDQAKDLLEFKNTSTKINFEEAKNKLDGIFSQMKKDASEHPIVGEKMDIKNIIITGNGK